jgi:hypothetical protein
MMIRQISFFVVVAIGLVVFIGTSVAPAAFASWGWSSRYIKQANLCYRADCLNYGSNTANPQGTSTSQSINQLNVCGKSECTNIASNTVK